MAPHPDLPSFVVLGPEPGLVVPAELRAVGPRTGEWQVSGDDLELTVTPDPSEADEPDLPPGIIDQLVTVRGRLRGERAREVNCRGCRSERVDAIQPGRFQLVRDVSGWLGVGEGFALIGVRPRRASGHGEERVTATLFSAGRSLPVAEPRISTTYADDGRPTRTTLELWLDDGDEPDQDDGSQYPRRAAGQASGPGTIHDVGRLAVRVQPLRWRSEGRDGVGVYLLVQAR